MTDIEMKLEVEAEELTQELFDEALDRKGSAFQEFTAPPGG